ncbi:MAG: hypothetical protein ABSG86_12970 [Thermoguttaceae bacterium]|jgi:hypothetical protein
MPVRQLAQLLALFGACLVIVGVAWASGSEIFLFIPGRRAWAHRPPTHPGVILGTLVTSLILTVWARQTGVYFFVIMAVGILLGSAVGFFVYGWTPSVAQHILAVAMIATSVYAWNQKSYFEE